MRYVALSGSAGPCRPRVHACVRDMHVCLLHDMHMLSVQKLAAYSVCRCVCECSVLERT